MIRGGGDNHSLKSKVGMGIWLNLYKVLGSLMASTKTKRTKMVVAKSE